MNINNHATRINGPQTASPQPRIHSPTNQAINQIAQNAIAQGNKPPVFVGSFHVREYGVLPINTGSREAIQNCFDRSIQHSTPYGVMPTNAKMQQVAQPHLNAPQTPARQQPFTATHYGVMPQLKQDQIQKTQNYCLNRFRKPTLADQLPNPPSPPTSDYISASRPQWRQQQPTTLAEAKSQPLPGKITYETLPRDSRNLSYGPLPPEPRTHAEPESTAGMPAYASKPDEFARFQDNPRTTTPQQPQRARAAQESPYANKKQQIIGAIGKYADTLVKAMMVNNQRVFENTRNECKRFLAQVEAENPNDPQIQTATQKLKERIQNAQKPFFERWHGIATETFQKAQLSALKNSTRVPSDKLLEFSKIIKTLQETIPNLPKADQKASQKRIDLARKNLSTQTTQSLKHVRAEIKNSAQLKVHSQTIQRWMGALDQLDIDPKQKKEIRNKLLKQVNDSAKDAYSEIKKFPKGSTERQVKLQKFEEVLKYLPQTGLVASIRKAVREEIKR